MNDISTPDIPEADEQQLRTTLHTIGNVIEDRIVEGPDDLFEPRRPRRLVLATTVAAAAAVLIVVAIVLNRGPTPTTTRVAAGSGQLDGLDVGEIGFESVLVSTPNAIVVARGNYDGHPAVYAPGRDGKYRWYVNESVPQLLPISAWWTDDGIRVIGNRCTNPGESYPPGGNCVDQPLMAITLSLDTLEWSRNSTTIDNHNSELWANGMVGNGQMVIAVPLLGSDSSAVTPEDESGMMSPPPRDANALLLIDLEAGSVTRLQDQTSLPLVCPSARTFLVSTTETERSTEHREEVRTVGIVDEDRIELVPIDGLGPSAPTNVSEGGCSDDGMVLLTGNDGDPPVAVTADPDGDSVTKEPLPSPPVDGTSVVYMSDITRTVLVATGTKPGSDRSYGTAVWDANHQTWRRLDNPPSSQLAAVDSDGRVFVIDNATSTLRFVP